MRSLGAIERSRLWHIGTPCPKPSRDRDVWRELNPDAGADLDSIAS